MKIGIIGAGQVGSIAANIMSVEQIASEIALADIKQPLAVAHADDMCHGLAFSNSVRVEGGGMESIAGSDIVITTAGICIKPGQSRLDLAATNSAIMADLLEAIRKYCPDAILIVANNPVEVLCLQAVERAGLDPARVIGTGTSLDSARFQVELSRMLDVSPSSIHASVYGEHGDSMVLGWSSARVGNCTLNEFLEEKHLPLLTPEAKTFLHEKVRKTAYRIKRDKGTTNFGVGGIIARITKAVVLNERIILPVTVWREEMDATKSVSLSLPAVLGRQGIIETLDPHLDEDETAALMRSAAIVKEAYMKVLGER